jgi:hypothetical protein
VTRGDKKTTLIIYVRNKSEFIPRIRVTRCHLVTRFESVNKVAFLIHQLLEPYFSSASFFGGFDGLCESVSGRL